MKKRKRHSDRSGRDALQSAGRPPVAQREDRRRNWAAIAGGQSSEDAASSAGVSPAVGTPGGGRHATSGVCIIIEAAFGAVPAVRGSGGDRAAACPRAWRPGDRPPPGAGHLDHLPGTAAECRHPQRGVSSDDRTVACRLLGAPAGQAGGQPGAAAVRAGSARSSPRMGRRAGRDVEGAPAGWAWSPEQIARRLRLDYPEDKTMRISHEAIYQALFIQGRGALRRDLTACLRSGLCAYRGPAGGASPSSPRRS